MKKNHEFVHGTKIQMNGEFGLVLLSNGKEEIRWDTNRKFDKEDWTGLFGTFIQNGGIIINQNFKFHHINEDGKLKKKI